MLPPSTPPSDQKLKKKNLEGNHVNDKLKWRLRFQDLHVAAGDNYRGGLIQLKKVNSMVKMKNTKQ